jgi:glycosyltransferase involved in cell wall biosynthesis
MDNAVNVQPLLRYNQAKIECHSAIRTAMRILFVAMLHHPDALRKAIAATPLGQVPYRFPPSAAQHFWEKVLRRDGHEVEVFYRNLPSWGGGISEQTYTAGWSLQRLMTAASHRLPVHLNPDYRQRNHHLIKQARTFRPDVLWITGDNSVILPTTIAQIKQETGCKVLYATGTSPIVFSHLNERKAARLYDLVLVNDYYHGIQWLEMGAPRMEALPIVACDPEFHHPYALTDDQQREFSCDIAFVGTLLPEALYGQRVQALERLLAFDLGIWSVHEVPTALRSKQRGKALGEDMLEVLSAAKLTINTHGDFMRYGGNMRLFEAAAVGVAQLADDLPGVQRWFTPGETIVTYSNLDDLMLKVQYYLKHNAEREALVQRARDHVYVHHTYAIRWQQLQNLL